MDFPACHAWLPACHVGIRSIIIYLLLKGQTKPSINQPTNQWEKDIYGVYLLFSVIFPSFLSTKGIRTSGTAHKLRQADFGIPAAAKGFVHHVLSFSEALISHGGTPSHHPAFRLGFSMKYSASSYWGQPPYELPSVDMIGLTFWNPTIVFKLKEKGMGQYPTYHIRMVEHPHFWADRWTVPWV